MIVPTVLVQLVAIYIFYDRHWGSVTRNLSRSLAGDIALIVEEFNNSTEEEFQQTIHNSQRFFDMRVSYTKGELFREQNAKIPAIHSKLASELKQFIIFPFAVFPVDGRDAVMIHIGLPEGVLSIHASSKRLTNPTTYIFIMWLTGTGLVLLGVTILFLRGQTRSIVRLTKAAERLGRGMDDPDFKPQGASEIRRAGIAFIAMRERIKRLILRRTEMLAGVSHDLKTRLARMKLQVAMLEEKKEAEALAQDILEMEQILESYLNFARDSADEPTKEIRLQAILKDILTSYRQQQDHITINNVTDDIMIEVKPTQFKRAVMNIIDNALRYATNVELKSKLKRKYLFLIFDDDGPGIDESHHQNVFQAFFRLEESRNTETGGTGLGLSITRDIIHRHGGDIRLERSPKQGLRVVIRMPLALHEQQKEA